MTNPTPSCAKKTIQRGLSLGLAIASLSMLAACQTVTRPNLSAADPKVAAIPLPSYVVGESFSYTGNRKQTVVAVDDKTVTWKTRNGVIRTAHLNPFLPLISWRYKDRHATSKSSVSNQTLWPPVAGASAGFLHTQNVSTDGELLSKRYIQRWQCDGEGSETVTTPAGTYNAAKVVCDRYYKRWWQQTRTFYYAPEVGYIVSRQDKYRRNDSKDVRLTKHEFDTSVLSDSDQAALGEMVRDFLETGAAGARKTWRDSTGQVTANIQMAEKIKSDRGRLCREYVGTFTVDGKTLTNHRRACRRSNGFWIQARLRSQQQP